MSSDERTDRAGDAPAFPPLLGPRFAAALVMAHELHRSQVRKGTAIPYVSHLLAVAAIALEHGADEDQAVAALLHDAAEDQGGQAILARIAGEFGPAVAAIVEACTDSFESPKPPWRERKERYLAHLAQVPPAAALVSAADKLHNARAIASDLRALGPGVFERFAGGREGTLWYYRSLALFFAQGAVPRRLADELASAVSEMSRYAV